MVPGEGSALPRSLILIGYDRGLKNWNRVLRVIIVYLQRD